MRFDGGIGRATDNGGDPIVGAEARPIVADGRLWGSDVLGGRCLGRCVGQPVPGVAVVCVYVVDGRPHTRISCDGVRCWQDVAVALGRSLEVDCCVLWCGGVSRYALERLDVGARSWYVIWR